MTPTQTPDFNRDARASFAAPSGSAFVRVAAIAPFWRYAVGPTASHSPAIPYYRLAAAEALFEKVKQELPWAGVVLYKRRGLCGIEEVKTYTPNENAQRCAAEGSGLKPRRDRRIRCSKS
jgi:hypothetical protein